MWPRTVEAMLALWLAASPFVFGYGDAERLWWVTDLVAAPLVLGFSLLSFWHRAHRAYLGTLALAIALTMMAYFLSREPAPPAAQNHLIVGILLAMLAILPSHNEQPPLAWRRYYQRAEDR